jgi:hypothetical protein
MEDISLHLLEARISLQDCYENINNKTFDKAMEEAEEALFHVRCCILWLKEKSNGDVRTS